MSRNSEKKLARIIPGNFVWQGPDRRKETDRRIRDRRTEVRYEPSKEDRRNPKERRQEGRDNDAYRQAKHPERESDD